MGIQHDLTMKSMSMGSTCHNEDLIIKSEDLTNTMMNICLSQDSWIPMIKWGNDHGK